MHDLQSRLTDPHCLHRGSNECQKPSDTNGRRAVAVEFAAARQLCTDAADIQQGLIEVAHHSLPEVRNRTGLPGTMQHVTEAATRNAASDRAVSARVQR